jgi:heat shock protein HspQ
VTFLGRTGWRFGSLDRHETGSFKLTFPRWRRAASANACEYRSRAVAARGHAPSLAFRRKSYYFGLMSKARMAKFPIGAVVKHRLFRFRGVVFDIDPVFANTEEWYQAIPAEVRPRKDQPFYHLFAENAETEYIAYVSEQNLLPDESGEPVRHPQVKQVFERARDGRYKPREQRLN